MPFLHREESNTNQKKGGIGGEPLKKSGGFVEYVIEREHYDLRERGASLLMMEENPEG